MFFRRASLVGFVLAVPAVMTVGLFVASDMVLQVTHRIIEPQILWYAAAIELPVFLFFAVLEAKDRW